MELHKNEFEYLQIFAKSSCGLVVPDDKEYLFTYRLAPIIEDRGYSGYEELCEKLKAGNKELIDKVITELTTHETFFFRDRHPFEVFTKVVLPWLEKSITERKSRSYVRKGAKANIWSAACSTGQETYSLAMLIDKYSENHSMETEDIEIIGTDISSDVLSKGMKATYKKFEVERGLVGSFEDSFRSKYFNNSGPDFEIVDKIKKMVEFKYCNLMDNFLSLGAFDVIFCRNVLIYFDENAKNKILKQFHDMLSPEGFLVLGASENIYGESTLFEADSSGEGLLYRKK